MSWLNVNSTRNILGGLLAGYGATSFLCFIVLDQIWISVAPTKSNITLGFIYLHNNHGSYTYFSKFQVTAEWLMFQTSIPLVFMGGFIMPRKNVKGIVRWYGASFKFDEDDPMHLGKKTMFASAILSPFFIFFIGPHIVRGLNAVGFVMNLG